MSDASSAPRRGGLRANLLLGLGVVAVAAILFELGTRLYAAIFVFPPWEAALASPRNYLQRSDDPILAYELKPGIWVRDDGRVLQINRYGLREESDDLFEGRRKLAILGDSVVMGAGVRSQEKPSRCFSSRPSPATARTSSC